MAQNPYMPPECVAANPSGKFCQIMGEFVMEFPGYGTVDLYANMNEHCGGEPPLYARIPQGC